ncbi:MAG: Flp pilus assembly protein CpaB [Planctomycetales bacterium]|nr:Flp pilus assembly protein CpaB [Planctomycetales bacterium]MBN8623859.1 Flp pilus assembly protein CpaB [Planctomycetota bacterium]
MARISTGTMTVGIFALLFGLAGAYALRAALTPAAVEPPAAPRTVPVPLASVTIPAGRQIALSDLALVPMTAEDMKSRKYDLNLVMLDSSQIIGRIAQTEVKQGEPILTTTLYPAGTGPKLSDKLKPGMRAVTIPIDNLAAVGGSTVEGSFVDVLFRSKKRDANPGLGLLEIPSTTVTLLENVEVLSVGRLPTEERGPTEGGLDIRQNRSAAAPKGFGANYDNAAVVSVTIAVTPDQANVVKTVMGQGDMSLALRGAGNGLGAVTPNKYTLEGILGVKHPTVASMDRIEIFRGSQSRQHVSFSNDQMVKNEVSLVPGLPSGMTFPVPDRVPAAPTTTPQEEKTYKPTPNIYGNGGGWGGAGGYGYGAGGYGTTGRAVDYMRYGGGGYGWGW